MGTVLFFLVAFLVVVFAFYGGIVLGIADCKREFGIPKGANPLEGEWCTDEEIANLYALFSKGEVDEDGCF